MENTKDQYIGAEIHSARSVNPDGETVTLDGDTVVWTGEEDVHTTGGAGRVPSRCNQTDGRKRTAERGGYPKQQNNCLVLKTAVTIAVVAAISFCYP